MSLTPITEVLSRILGLAPASLGEPALRRCVERRMRATGDPDLIAYARRLRRSAAETRALIDTVVVPESWFFREPAAFELLRDQLQPSRLGRPPRLLSLGCSTGEEPYSLAMCLLDAGWRPGSFELTGIDISRPALVKAHAAEYGARSFRGQDLGFRERWFIATQKGYRLREPARGCVRFHRGNILLANSRWHACRFDVIFLRNVLIYFTEPAQRRIITRLRQMLMAGGMLFAGHAEANLYLDAGFAKLAHARAFAFSPPNLPQHPPREAAQARPQRQTQLPPKRRSAPAPRRSQPTSAPTSPPSMARAARDPAPATLRRIEQLADLGQLATARRQCLGYLDQHGSSPEALYLLALIQGASGDLQAAWLTYRKVLYLAPEHGPALVQMALIAERRGDTERAQRLRERAHAAEAQHAG